MAETLDFENPRALQALYANDLRLLKSLEEALKVKVTTREGWVRLEGEPENVGKARKVFEQLDTARKNGVEIRRHEFDYALRSVTQPDGNGSGLGSLVDSRITVSPRRAPIVPKTAGQRNYLQLIEKHDIVFGIGPAGTGKTYLAMAMAVSALKREQVTRIILTRPAVEAGEALGFLPAPAVRRAGGYAGSGGDAAAHGSRGHRGGAAGVHAGAYVEPGIHRAG